MIELTANGEQFSAYRADPPGAARGALIVIHEIWGLVDHIKDVADRFAAEGYVAVAPDLMGAAGLDAVLVAALGKDMADPAKRTAAQPKIREAMAPMQSPRAGARIQAAVAQVFDYLQGTPEGSGRTAVAGFCFGGTYSFALAVSEPRLVAAVPFYGHTDAGVEELSRINCPVLAFYGEEDQRLADGLPDLATRMKEAGVDFSYTLFPATGHAFFNDSNPIAYRPDPARIAWQKTLDFLAANTPGN